MILTPQAMKRRSEEEELDGPPCLSCGSSGETVLVVEFRGVSCNCKLLPFPHPYREPLCADCRRMLTLARARMMLWKSRN